MSLSQNVFFYDFNNVPNLEGSPYIFEQDD